MFQRASFLSIDRDSGWDLAMCVFAIDETATLILLSVKQHKIGIKGEQPIECVRR